jgi:hypothetical protein
MTKPDGGKGSKQRPTDQNKYGQGYDLIFKKKPVKAQSIDGLGGEMLDKLGEALAVKRKTLEGGQIESDHSYRERLKQVCFGMPQLQTP